MPESERPFNVEDRLTASYTLRSAGSGFCCALWWVLDLFIISFIMMMAIWMLINVLHPFGWNFDPYPFILLNLALFYDCGDSSSFDHDEPKQAAITIACKREMTLTSIWNRNGKFACCIRRLTIWFSKTRRIYWKFKKLQNRIVGVLV